MLLKEGTCEIGMQMRWGCEGIAVCSQEGVGWTATGGAVSRRENDKESMTQHWRQERVHKAGATMQKKGNQTSRARKRNTSSNLLSQMAWCGSCSSREAPASAGEKSTPKLLSSDSATERHCRSGKATIHNAKHPMPDHGKQNSPTEHQISTTG